MEIQSIKENLNQRVKLKGHDEEYLFSGYILRKQKDKFIHQAELLDVKNGNSVAIAKLEDVEEIKNEI